MLRTQEFARIICNGLRHNLPQLIGDWYKNSPQSFKQLEAAGNSSFWVLSIAMAMGIQGLSG
ncbi:hypothetical protein OH77DRAFT_1425175 [Trametes cingulata]|nr:hypothetical protein OH77DRAFT_1425175 [Trametes cingulata]